MKDSVVLPRADTWDTVDARHALEQARLSWAKGRQRDAVDLIRQAARAESSAGHEERSLALLGTASALQQRIDPSRSEPPLPPVAAASVASVPKQATGDDAPLIVTVAPSSWSLPTSNAVVGHSAQRVVVLPGVGPEGVLTVRPLAPGEVAPRGASIAVLVTL